MQNHNECQTSAQGNDDDDAINVVGDYPPLPPPLPAENAAQIPQYAQNRPRLTRSKVHFPRLRPCVLDLFIAWLAPAILTESLTDP